jgi:FkbM family methyltransferase
MQDDLIFDLGMHRGEDTDFYLKKGYRVVGIEADPELAEHCRRRFATRIADGTLRIFEGAIVARERAGQGAITFYKNPGMSVWGTVDPRWRDRNAGFGQPSREIQVQCLDLAAILRDCGVPLYMKIDIEGADRLCLEYLKDCAERPRYLSIEDEKVDFAKLLQDIETLCALGYRPFRAVQQQTIPNSIHHGSDRGGRPVMHRFEEDASGVFGPDFLTAWMTRDELLVEYKWIYEMYRIFGDASPFARDPNLATLRMQLERHFQRPLPGWHDTHAAL